MTFKPHLSGKVDLDNLHGMSVGVLAASPKLDGIRYANIGDGRALARSLKPLPSRLVQEVFGVPELMYFDGEMIQGPANGSTVYRDTFSAVMAKDGGDSNTTLHVFDYWERPELHYWERNYLLLERISKLPTALANLIHVVPLERIGSKEQLLAFEAAQLEDGLEGIMTRRIDRAYKFGRSSNSAKDSALLKLKRLEESEGLIIGVECSYHNANEAVTNALGRTERSTHKANLVPLPTLGKVFIRDLQTGVESALGIFKGFTKPELEALWADQDNLLLGRIVKYEHFPYGAKDKPRQGVMLGFRDPIDMS